MYIVNFNTGAGNQEVATLEEAKQVAVDLMTYTQRDITIETEDGEVIATARWHGYEPSEDEIEDGRVLEVIGGGFYARWDDEE